MFACWCVFSYLLNIVSILVMAILVFKLQRIGKFNHDDHMWNDLPRIHVGSRKTSQHNWDAALRATTAGKVKLSHTRSEVNEVAHGPRPSLSEGLQPMHTLSSP